MGNTMPRRQYSDEEKGTALAALDANGGNVERTAQQIGIPRKTLAGWAVSRGAGPAVADLRQRKRGPMADALVAVAWRLLDAIPQKIKKAPLNQTAVALGIALDKARLLRGEPTSITSGEVTHDCGPDLAPYADAFGDFARAVLGGGGPPVHANGAPQPVHPP
jgi:transposase-like protein